jgi:hypothetical protein
MTVAEYRALGRWRRCLVRITNHPIVANLLLPPLDSSPENRRQEEFNNRDA